MLHGGISRTSFLTSFLSSSAMTTSVDDVLLESVNLERLSGNYGIPQFEIQRQRDNIQRVFLKPKYLDGSHSYVQCALEMVGNNKWRNSGG